MAKMKTEFQMVWASGHHVPGVKASIVGTSEKGNKPYLSLNAFSSGNSIFIQDKDLERFAVNILRALNSKRLKP